VVEKKEEEKPFRKETFRTFFPTFFFFFSFFSFLLPFSSRRIISPHLSLWPDRDVRVSFSLSLRRVAGQASIFTAEVSSFFFFDAEKKNKERKKGKHWKQGRE